MNEETTGQLWDRSDSEVAGEDSLKPEPSPSSDIVNPEQTVAEPIETAEQKREKQLAELSEKILSSFEPISRLRYLGQRQSADEAESKLRQSIIDLVPDSEERERLFGQILSKIGSEISSAESESQEASEKYDLASNQGVDRVMSEASTAIGSAEKTRRELVPKRDWLIQLAESVTPHEIALRKFSEEKFSTVDPDGNPIEDSLGMILARRIIKAQFDEDETREKFWRERAREGFDILFPQKADADLLLLAFQKRAEVVEEKMKSLGESNPDYSKLASELRWCQKVSADIRSFLGEENSSS